ncbi:MAG: hypothetical protein OXC07_00675 [Kistimonas sp.]|nr:hypothetical protein [Kistimonas sp.]
MSDVFIRCQHCIGWLLLTCRSKCTISPALRTLPLIKISHLPVTVMWNPFKARKKAASADLTREMAGPCALRDT